MGKKSKFRIAKLFTGNAIAVWILLLAAIVIATAPSNPSILSPVNKTTVVGYNTTLTCSGSTDAESNPINYTFYAYNVTYQLSGADTWANTVTACSGLGAGWHLVTVDTAEEQRYLRTTFSGANRWIGLVSPSTWNYGLSSFTNWTAGQPDSPGDCTAMITASSMEWNDLGCGGALTGICENNNITSPLQNSSSTSFVYNLSRGGDIFKWYCQACDNNSECSSNSETRTLYSALPYICGTGTSYKFNLYNESNALALTGTITSNNLFSSSYYHQFSGTGSSLGICLTSSPESITLQTNATALATNFINRNFIFPSTSITNVSGTTYNLYLLDLSSGAYITFQVVDSGGSPVINAYITAQKIISGSLVTITSGYTDDSGIVTFWLDPLSTHTISASKSGVGSTSFSITPTQSSYTITLGGSTQLNQTNPYFGINYNILPTNIILNNNTVYTFRFNISSSYWNLTNYGFNLINSTGGILNTSTGAIITGSALSVLLNTNNMSSVTMNYWWNINGNYTNLSQEWKVHSTYEGELSIKNFFDDLDNYLGVGFNAGFDNFGKIIISIILIVLVVGWLSFEFGIYSPLGIGALVVLLSFFLETVNFLPPLIRKYLLSIILVVIWLGFATQEESK